MKITYFFVDDGNYGLKDTTLIPIKIINYFIYLDVSTFVLTVDGEG